MKKNCEKISGKVRTTIFHQEPAPSCGNFRDAIYATTCFVRNCVLVLSALFFTRECFNRICAAAFFYAAFAADELWRRDQAAHSAIITAIRILAALITQHIDVSADLRWILPAREVKTMAIYEPAAGRCRECRCNHRRSRGNCTARLGRCAACDRQGEHYNTYRRYDEGNFHQNFTFADTTDSRDAI